MSLACEQMDRLILPLGTFECKGRSFRLGAECAEKIAAETDWMAVDSDNPYNIYVEFRSLVTPAIAWARISAREDGLWVGHVETTTYGSRVLADGPWYIVPVFRVGEDGEVKSLIALSLTRTPAFRGLVPIGDVTCTTDYSAAFRDRLHRGPCEPWWEWTEWLSYAVLSRSVQ